MKPGERIASLVDALNQLRDSSKPVIAAINGFAFAGGLGLVAAADIAITSDTVLYSFRIQDYSDSQTG